MDSYTEYKFSNNHIEYKFGNNQSQITHISDLEIFWIGVGRWGGFVKWNVM